MNQEDTNTLKLQVEPAAHTAIEMVETTTNNISLSDEEKEDTASYTTDQDHGSSVEEISADLLKLDNGGRCGCIERIPMSVKLLFLSTVAVFGLLLVAATVIYDRSVQLNDVQQKFSYLDLADKVFKFIKSVEAERRAFSDYLYSNSNDLAALTAVSQFVATSSLHQNFNAVLTVLDNSHTNIERKLASLKKTIVGISQEVPMVRNRVVMRNITSVDMYNFYTMFSDNFLSLTSTFATGSFIQQEIIQHLLLLQMRALQGNLYAFTKIYSKSALPRTFFKQYTDLLGRRNEVVDVTTALLSQEMNDFFENYKNQPLIVAELGVLELEISASPVDGHMNLSNPVKFDSTFENMMRMMDDLTLHSVSLILRTLGETSNTSVVGIVVIVIIIVVCFFAVLITSAVVSGTIIGPWKRLNVLQQLTISKFVPKAYLKDLKCKSIADVSLGKNSTVDKMAILVLGNNGSDQSVAVKGPQLVDFVNDYLGYLSPTIRAHGGYVDRYNFDGVVLIFRNPKKALRCALEIQRCTETYNEKVIQRNRPKVHIGMGLHAGAHILIGAIGENERIQPTILSEDYQIAHKLQKLTSLFRANIIASNSFKMEKGLTPPTRNLGVLRTASKGDMNFYEVITNSTQNKLRTRDVFSKAVTCMLEGEYSYAASLFEVVLQETSKEEDPAAQHYSTVAKRILKTNKKTMFNLGVVQTLRDKSLMEAFESHCAKEYSQENIILWKLIEDFKEFVSLASRKLIAKRILQEFLDIKGGESVNITSPTRNHFKTKIEAVVSQSLDTELKSNDLFKDLQEEIEFVMSDTHKRFKDSELFTKAFKHSAYCATASTLYFKMEEKF